MSAKIVVEKDVFKVGTSLSQKHNGKGNIAMEKTF